MNILLISHFFPPHKGGIETAAYNTAKKLKEREHTVIVLTSKVKGATSRFEVMDGFCVYRFKPYGLIELRGFPQSSSLGFSFRFIFILKKLIKKHNIQIIHIEGRFFPISIISAFLNLLVFKRKMVLTAQGRLKIGITGLIENIFDRTITRLIYSRLDHLICVSKALKDRFYKYKIPISKLLTIPNGVDIQRFSSKTKDAYFDRFIKDTSNTKKVLFAGRLDQQKGVEYLILAIPQVIQLFESVKFFILGNGRLENHLKELASSLNIQNYVMFMDMIPIDKMPEVFGSVDIFCLPSLHEGFPLSLIEATSMGLVIVASNIGGIPEVINEPENGFLFHPKNVLELKKQLLKALELSQDEILQIRNNNIKKARSNYSWDSIIAKIIRIYQEKTIK